MITAINKTHQSSVNKCYKNYRKYHELVNAEVSENKQSIKFDTYYNLFNELPKREQVNFEKQHLALHGYT